MVEEVLIESTAEMYTGDELLLDEEDEGETDGLEVLREISDLIFEGVQLLHSILNAILGNSVAAEDDELPY